MNGFERWLARLIANLTRLIRPAEESHKPVAAAPRRHNALASPWRVYRIYATPTQILLRSEQGKVVDLGSVSGVAPSFGYRLNAGGGRGENGFATLTELLDSVAASITSGQVESDLTSLPLHKQTGGVDLDKSAHLDVSMQIAL
jgi:hypothetical protein